MMALQKLAFSEFFVRTEFNICSIQFYIYRKVLGPFRLLNNKHQCSDTNNLKNILIYQKLKKKTKRCPTSPSGILQLISLDTSSRNILL